MRTCRRRRIRRSSVEAPLAEQTLAYNPLRNVACRGNTVKLNIESEREEDGRWLAEVPELPGVLAYGASRDEALAKAQVLALRVLAERIEHNEGRPEPISISIAA
jgi:predicted RNase H-like HicB family nuclease